MGSLGKISRPRLPRVVARPRLFRLLDSARQRPATWVVGPPGAGKTTLVASWLSSRKLRSLWYQVDAGDADPATFFYYLAAAAEKLAPRRPQLPALTPEYALDVFTRGFFAELCARLRAPTILVFDNCQEAPPGSPFEVVLREALQELPDGTSAVLVSRQEPPGCLARLRAHELLHVVPAEELKLTTREAAEIARLRGYTMSAAAAAAACDRLHGWAAGLVLTVAGGSTAPRPSSASAKPQLVFDYFAGEIFDRVDDETRQVLLETALAPNVTGALARRLTGRERAGVVLTDLARRGYFTVRHEGIDSTYEYHPLFRDFLLARAKESMSPQRLAETRRRAGLLLRDSGQLEAAVELLGDAEAWEELASTILSEAAPLLRAGRAATLGSWIGSLPSPVLERYPWLRYWAGMCRLPFDPAAAREPLERAFAAFKMSGDAAGAYLAWSAIVNSYLHEWGDLILLDRWVAELEVLRRQFPLIPTPDIEAGVLVAILTALAFRQPDHPTADEWVGRGVEFVLGESDLPARVLAAMPLVIYLSWFKGNVRSAERVVTALRPLVHVPDVPPGFLIQWRASEGAYHQSRLESEDAIRVSLDGLELARASGIHLWDVRLESFVVWASVARGDWRTAVEYLDRISPTADRSLLSTGQYMFARGTYALCRGDHDVAAECARVGIDVTIRSGFQFGLLLMRLLAARADECRDELESAEEHLRAASRVGEATGSWWCAFMVALIGATIAYRRSDEPGGDESLRRAFALAREHALTAFLCFTRSELADLYARALEKGIEPEHAEAMIRRLKLDPGERARDVEQWPWPIRIRTLGGFEIWRDGDRVEFARKTQKRPLDLLKLLVAAGPGRGAREEVLADALWPDAEADKAHHALETTVYRLRKLLGHEVIVARENRISLNEASSWVDAWALERKLAQASARLGRDADCAEVVPLAMRAFELHRGPFLPDECSPWAFAARDDLREKMLRFLGLLAARPPDTRRKANALLGHLDADHTNAARELRRRAIAADPALEQGSGRDLRA
jgi:LuxR family maltose regulon positive regulatory protein